MAFFEQQLDPSISYGAKGGPVFSTSKAYTQSGQRSANRNWSAPLHRYDISPCVRTEATLDLVRNFFYVVAGSFDGFRYKDWLDYRCAQADGGLLLVSSGIYQMTKRYVLGSRTFTRTIQKPVAGAQIFRTRSGSTTNITGGDAAVDTTTGRVTVAGHVAGDTYAWSGEFDVPVAFVSDEFQPEIVSLSDGELVVAPGQMLLEEIRL